MSGATIEVSEWMSNFTTDFTEHVIICDYLC